MELGVVIAVIGCALSVATFFVGRISAEKKEGREAGELAKDIEYIKKSVDRIDRRFDSDLPSLESRLNANIKLLEGRLNEQTKSLIGLGEKVGGIHESTKSAHNRIDEHLEREHGQIVAKRKEYV